MVEAESKYEGIISRSRDVPRVMGFKATTLYISYSVLRASKQNAFSCKAVILSYGLGWSLNSLFFFFFYSLVCVCVCVCVAI
jgi:hypothetical protein